MRYRPCPRHPFRRTRRKDLAAGRKLRRQREALPLLAELVAAGQPSVDEVMARREREWRAAEQRQRDFRAGQWRAVRRRLFALPAGGRRQVLAEWDKGRYPADPVYLAYLIRRLERTQP